MQLVCAVLLSACALPRGAALQSEILTEQQSETPGFQVVAVTRETTPQLAQWPVTGWFGHYHWLPKDTGPDSGVILTGDTLEMAVWESQENSLLAGVGSKMTELPRMTVSENGAVFVPYVGDVEVRGMTTGAARNVLQSRLEEIAPSVQVQLSVVPGRNNAVDLVGGVASPGRYPLDSRATTILSVIAQGGGIDPGLRNPLVRLQRDGRGYDILAADLLRAPARNVRLRGGDQITIIEDDRSFNVLGAAGTQQLVYFERDTMSAMEALSVMGGLQASRANPKGILVLRDYKAKDLKPGMAGPDMRQVVFTLDLTSADGLFAARQFQIHPGDTLLATESPVSAVRSILGLLGTLVGVTGTVETL
ncbi:polysaccharide biosynthesis/export family protein [Roseovarius sp.]|jgi:polysaccharide export outer membrane protein